MIAKLIHALAVVALIGTTTAVAQNRPQAPSRPPWQDVCCGGPCCKARPAR